ncbi:uncharacterized protein LOC129313105 [Prosopis cineraria]|uniref:uncharacterized protein LOC129313105 n=1 Tax=Prosopis cineraria TaxID=364024 RepID=UPI002410AB5E|nr:uncharacterized protein LOC129313105 [Prosopis cineraria]
MLPSLKEMELCGVPRLSGIFRNYEQLKSLSMQKPSSPLSRHKSNKIHQILATCALSWVQACCSLNKSRPASEETNLTVSDHGPLDHTNPMGLLASEKWIETAATIKRQLLHVGHIKKMELVDFFLNSKSTLFTLSMASIILWEELTIGKCDGLKHLVTSDEDDYKDQKKCSSIFPNLKKLEIRKCNDMEFLFPSTISLEIKNLRSWTIRDAPKLTQIVRKYHHKDLSANPNPQNDLHFDLPALEFLCFQGVPNMISICVKNYYFLVSPSLYTVSLDNCGIISFIDLIFCSSEECLNWEITKRLDLSTDIVHRASQATQSIRMQSLINIKKMELVTCANLISLFALHDASILSLEELTVKRCDQLKCIVADEGGATTHMNHNSIFPKLKQLDMSECNVVEYLFPASAFRSPMHLERLRIKDAPKLEYVLGRSSHDDNLSHQNQNIKICIDFLALKSLGMHNVPKLVSLCPKNFCLRGLSLEAIILDIDISSMSSIKSFNDFMVCDHATQDSTTIKLIEMRLHALKELTLANSKIEEIFNLKNLDAKKNKKRLEPLTSSLQELVLINLWELRNICVGPKCILSLKNLSELQIRGCKKLEVVFSTSTLRSLPQLEKLWIWECEELVKITEEDNEESAGDHLPHQPCFPKLIELRVVGCHRLKYLFSITRSGILPKLQEVCIEDAYALEHVLIRPFQPKEMAKKDVLPELRYVELGINTSLINICHGIDFQTLENCSKLYGCPKFSFHETIATQHQDGPKNLDSNVEAKTGEKASSHPNTNQSDMGDTKGSPSLKTHQSRIGPPNFTMETTNEIAEEDVVPEMPKVTNLSSDSKAIDQLETRREIVEEDAIAMMPKMMNSWSDSKAIDQPVCLC